MEQRTLGARIAERRKACGYTQAGLAERLGVTDKAISKWETGRGMPDVSLYPQLCRVLGLRLEDFFSSESEPSPADPPAPESETFSPQERIDFFKAKWQKDHLFECAAAIAVIVGTIIFGFVTGSGLQYAGMAGGLLCGLVERNRMMTYIERNVYVRPNIKKVPVQPCSPDKK